MTCLFWIAGICAAAALADNVDFEFIPRLINDTLILWGID